MTGEDHPRPGNGVFQTTFSVSDHCMGGLCSLAWPLEFGPRNWGQLPWMQMHSAIANLSIGGDPVVGTVGWLQSLGRCAEPLAMRTEGWRTAY